MHTCMGNTLEIGHLEEKDEDRNTKWIWGK